MKLLREIIKQYQNRIILDSDAPKMAINKAFSVLFLIPTLWFRSAWG